MTYEWSPERDCGTIKRETIAAVSFACPHSVGVASVIAGAADRVVVRYPDGTRSAVKIKPIRDRSGVGTFFALTVPAGLLPAEIIRIDGKRRRSVTVIDALSGICSE